MHVEKHAFYFALLGDKKHSFCVVNSMYLHLKNSAFTSVNHCFYKILKQFF